MITKPLVENLPSYVKDTNHMLDIANSFRFSGTYNYVFTMYIKSLYTVIPNNDGLLALTHFLNKRTELQPPTHTLVRLAELVLTLNIFSFNGDYYQQTGGVPWEAVSVPAMRVYSLATLRSRCSSSTKKKHLT